MIDIYNSKVHTWIKRVRTGLSTYCYYNEATSWIDCMLSRAPGGGIMQAVLRRAVGCVRFFAEFQKNSEKTGEKFRATATDKLQSHNCNEQILYQLWNSRLTNAQIGYIMNKREE